MHKNRERGRHALCVALLGGLLLTGCASKRPPPVDEVAEQARQAEAQRLADLEKQLADKQKQCADEKKRLEMSLRDTQRRLDDTQKKLDAVVGIDRSLRRKAQTVER